VLADKEFEISDILQYKGAYLNIPSHPPEFREKIIQNPRFFPRQFLKFRDIKTAQIPRKSSLFCYFPAKIEVGLF
jgi:hypothetical protein